MPLSPHSPYLDQQIQVTLDQMVTLMNTFCIKRVYFYSDGHLIKEDTEWSSDLAKTTYELISKRLNDLLLKRMKLEIEGVENESHT